MDRLPRTSLRSSKGPERIDVPPSESGGGGGGGLRRSETTPRCSGGRSHHGGFRRNDPPRSSNRSLGAARRNNNDMQRGGSVPSHDGVPLLDSTSSPPTSHDPLEPLTPPARLDASTRNSLRSLDGTPERSSDKRRGSSVSRSPSSGLDRLDPIRDSLRSNDGFDRGEKHRRSSRMRNGLSGSSMVDDKTTEAYQEDTDPEDIVVINVGGVRSETFKKTLLRMPGTRLSMMNKQDEHWRPDANEYFFDRHPVAFSAVLNYYRTGELHVPNDICGPQLEKELSFWGIEENSIEQCCWISYCAKKQQKNRLEHFDYESSEDEAVREKNLCKRWRAKLWKLLDDPHSSKAAIVTSIVSLLFVLGSIFVFCAETVPYFQTRLTDEEWAALNDIPPAEEMDIVGENGTIIRGYNSTRPTKDGEYYSRNSFLDHMDIICNMYLVIEFIIRAVISPSKVKFLTNLLNIIDFIAIMPFVIEQIVDAANPMEKFQESFVDAIAFLRIFRIFRIFRLMKYSAGVRVLAYTLRSSLSELSLILLFMVIGVLIFSSLIYYADHEDAITTIPLGFWWALITMTTVGYGDYHPKSPMGYLVGSACALTGILFIGVTIPVIVSNFMMYYNHAISRTHRERFNKEKREKRRERKAWRRRTIRTHETGSGEEKEQAVMSNALTNDTTDGGSEANV